MGREASYAAAKNGDFVMITINHRKLVNVAATDAKHGLPAGLPLDLPNKRKERPTPGMRSSSASAVAE
jgi:hypothetical protein